MNVRELIGKFWWGSEDWELARSIFAAAPLPEIFATLSAMIEDDAQIGNDRSELYVAVGFIQDIGLSAPSELKKQFRKYFTRSRLLKQMRNLLYSDDRTVRERVRYALDKLTMKSNGIYFEKALFRFYENDPLWTDGLLFGLAWIRHAVNLDAIMHHPNYLVRWPVLSRHQHIHDPNDILRKRRELDFFLRDENAWIRAEAEHCYREMLFEEQWPTITEQEYQRRSNEIEDLRPKFDWDLISMRFQQSLSRFGRNSYSLEEFGAFVEELAKKNE